MLSKTINKSTAPEEAVKPTQHGLRKANPKLKVKRTEKVWFYEICEPVVEYMDYMKECNILGGKRIKRDLITRQKPKAV